MGKGFGVLNLVKPLLAFLSEVQPARKQVSLREKLLYTTITLLIFLNSQTLQERNCNRLGKRCEVVAPEMKACTQQKA
ncbi:unnamed protein product [Calypogeia fissa]